MMNRSHEMENANFSFFVIFHALHFKNGLRVAMNL